MLPAFSVPRVIRTGTFGLTLHTPFDTLNPEPPRGFVVDEPERLIEKARSSAWGYIRFPRGTILFMRLNSDQVVLVEPDGGYFYPFREPVKPTDMPDEDTLASALTGLSQRDLKSVAKYTRQPRTMQEIQERFPDVEAWRLRRLGFLTDVGRRDHRIISRWVGYDLPKLLRSVFQLATVGIRKVNS